MEALIDLYRVCLARPASLPTVMFELDSLAPPKNAFPKKLHRLQKERLQQQVHVSNPEQILLFLCVMWLGGQQEDSTTSSFLSQLILTVRK